MPKIVREDDDFSSFIWKDLSRDALAFVHAHYFSDEMTVDDYIKTYYSNKIRYFKEEADRLFEEAKETCLLAGTFPEALNDVWTRQVIKKSDSPSENKVKSLFSQTKPIDKNAVERSNLTQKMKQIENELDDLARLSRNFEENNLEFIRSTQSLLHTSDELTNQTAHHDQKEAYQEQATFYELQQTLAYYVNRQNDTLNEKARIAKINKEVCLEKLYQERNKLAW